MSRRPISLTLGAEADAQEAAHWYEAKVVGLGHAWLDEFQRTLDSLPENPLRFPLVYRDVRRALVNRFPYGVFFRLRGTRIRVIAVAHLARHPSAWTSRV